jgi:hypothetical protein
LKRENARIFGEDVRCDMVDVKTRSWNSGPETSVMFPELGLQVSSVYFGNPFGLSDLQILPCTPLVVSFLLSVPLSCVPLSQTSLFAIKTL